MPLKKITSIYRAAQPLLRHASRTTAAATLLVAAAGAHAQSLAELVESARGYDSGLIATRLSSDAASLRIAQSKSGLLPTAALTAGASRSNSNIWPGPRDQAAGAQNAAVSANFPLLRAGVKVGITQAERAAELARVALESAEQDLIVRVAQAYFDVLAAGDTLTFVKAQKTAVGEQLASAKRNFEVGTSTITDSREAQARFDLVIAQEVAAENDLKVKRMNLDQVVGRANLSPKPLMSASKLPALAPAEVGEWLAAADSNHPNVRQSQLALDLAKLETEKARTAEKPTLDLQGSYGINRSDPAGANAGTSRAHTLSVGVAFNMPLYTGNAVQNRIKETLVLEDKARADLDTTKRGVATATRTAYFGVASGLGQVKALEAAELSSQSALDANKLGYTVGVRINIDVLNSQSQLFQTKRDLARARYDVLVGGLRLRQANGTLQIADVLQVDTLLAK